MFISLPLLSSNFSPQYKRKSTEGVSFFLFALVILGNTTYGMSVLLKNPDEGQGESSYMIHHLPWLIGSLGTLSLDLIVSFKEQKMWLLWPGPSLIPCTCYILASADLVGRTFHHMGFGLMTKENTICGNTICSITGPNTHREIECKSFTSVPWTTRVSLQSTEVVYRSVLFCFIFSERIHKAEIQEERF